MLIGAELLRDEEVLLEAATEELLEAGSALLDED